MPTVEKQTNVTKRRRRKPTALTPKQQREVKQMIQMEDAKDRDKKWFDTGGEFNASWSIPQVFSITQIPKTQGVDAARETNDVELVDYSIRILVQLDAGTSTTFTTNVVRIMLVQWFEDGQAYGPGLSNILSSVVQYRDLFAHYNLKQNGTYKVLHDEILQVTREDPSTFINVFKNKGFRKRLQYDDTNTYGINNLYLIVWTDDYQSISTGPFVRYKTRVRFYDIE